jgi:NAD+ kinase
MRVFVFSLSPQKEVKRIKKLLLKKGFIISAYKPDIIVSYGGDGTFLTCERNYPSIPKILLRDEGEKTKEIDVTIDELDACLNKIKRGLYKIVEFFKVEAIVNNKKLIGLNEVQIRNKLPIEALRFNVRINGKSIENVVADGIIVATPFGSTGYYSSAGGKKFKNGLGICLNNPHNIREKSKRCIVVNDRKKILVRIIHGEAYLAADNSRNIIGLRGGDEVRIKKSEEKARVIKVK